MFIDRTVEFLLSIILVSVLVVMSVPMDYDGVSPQESFTIGFEAGFAEGMESVEDILNQWVMDLYGAETLEELEALAIEEVADLLGEEVTALLAGLDQDMSISEAMGLVYDILMADPFFAELVADVESVPAPLLLALIPEDFRNELVLLFTEEVVLDILDGWYIQMMIGVIVQEVGLDALIEGFADVDFDSDYSFSDDINYFIGEGTWGRLTDIEDVNERLHYLGYYFGAFIGDWLAENIDAFIDALDALTALANMFALDFDLDDIHELPLHFAETDLEERVAFSVSGILSTKVITSDLEDANLNVFIVNTGNNPVTVVFETGNLQNNSTETVFEEVLAPGQRFTRQVTADELDEVNMLLVVGGNLADVMMGSFSTMSVDIALRMTANPL